MGWSKGSSLSLIFCLRAPSYTFLLLVFFFPFWDIHIDNWSSQILYHIPGDTWPIIEKKKMRNERLIEKYISFVSLKFCILEKGILSLTSFTELSLSWGRNELFPKLNCILSLYYHFWLAAECETILSSLSAYKLRSAYKQISINKESSLYELSERLTYNKLYNVYLLPS